MINMRNMKSILLRLDENEYEKLKELKSQGGFKSWEDFFLSLGNTDEDLLTQMRKNKLKEKLFDVFAEAQVLSKKYQSELELVRVIAVKLLDGDNEKARELVQALLIKLSDEEETEVTRTATKKRDVIEKKQKSTKTTIVAEEEKEHSIDDILNAKPAVDTQ